MDAPAATPAVNVDDARGLSFACQPGCGFCCTANPLVLPHEAPRLGPLVVRSEDGSLRIPVRGAACSALGADRACTVYENRPAVCHLYPFQVHAGRRLQVSVSLGCPGISGEPYGPHRPARHAVHPVDDTDDMARGAKEAVRVALAQPGAPEMAERARETFREFDRRMREWGVIATPDRLRAAFVPHVETLARPEALPAYFASIADGALVLDGDARRRVAALFEPQAEMAEVSDLLADAASEAFDEPDVVIWVEPDHAWTTVAHEGGKVRLRREKDQARRPDATFDVESLPIDWTPEASGTLARYLERLCHRDHTEGAACWLVDASGYQATLPAAYARVLGEASLQVVLRAGLLGAEMGADVIDEPLARRAIAAYETSFHSLPTLGSVL